jgi:hypothetical protein
LSQEDLPTRDGWTCCKDDAIFPRWNTLTASSEKWFGYGEEEELERYIMYHERARHADVRFECRKTNPRFDMSVKSRMLQKEIQHGATIENILRLMEARDPPV